MSAMKNMKKILSLLLCLTLVLGFFPAAFAEEPESTLEEEQGIISLVEEESAEERPAPEAAGRA